MGNPKNKDQHRSVVRYAAEVGMEFDFLVDPAGHGQLELRAGAQRYRFVDNVSLMRFLDGVRAGRLLCAAEEAADAAGVE